MKQGAIRDDPTFQAGSGGQTIVFSRGSKREWVATLVVDPGRHFIPTHLTLVRLGKVQTQLFIRYSQGDGGEVIPQEWNWKNFDDGGRLIEQGNVRISEGETNNEISDSLFQVVFPYGSWVNEHEGGKDRVFLVMKNDTRRYLSGVEADTNQYERLMDPSILSWERSRRLWIAGFTVVASVVLFVQLYRKRARGRSASV